MNAAAAVPTAAWQLSAAMRAASQEEHDAAERSPFISELLRGGLGKEAYAAYLARLRPIYAALEEAVRRHRNDAVIAAFYDPALERLPAIEADLHCWSDGSPRSIDSPAAGSYCRRLESIDNGPALLAHHYTRYLGDLSGGQAIGRTLDRVFNLGGIGLAFYAFPMQPKRLQGRLSGSPRCPRPADRTDRDCAARGQVRIPAQSGFARRTRGRLRSKQFT